MILIFIPTYNRLETLKRTIESYRRMAFPYELVIVDNGSDQEGCINLLHELKRLEEVRDVYFMPRVYSYEAMTDNINAAMEWQYKTTNPKHYPWFAVSDPDISFESADPLSFAAYVSVASELGIAAGPHLGVNPPPPTGYPLRTRVLATETRLLYRDQANWCGKIPYSYAPIDTTFHLFERRSDFPRLKMNAVRVGGPYAAMHLDWYVDVFEPTQENWITMRNTATIGSWGHSWIKGYWSAYRKGGAEGALQKLHSSAHNPHDFCNNYFMLSWCYQYGIGCEPDHEASVRFLKGAIPGNQDVFLAREDEFMKMIYEDDFSVLGWDE